MASRKHRQQMKDYLVSKLETSYDLVLPIFREISSGIMTSFIDCRNDTSCNRVFLVDQPYPHTSLCDCISIVSPLRSGGFAVVLLKDGETFFRNAAEKNHFKQDKDLSLKHYSDEEMHRMISFRPEEIFLNSRARPWLQYFQPESPYLREGLESFQFRPVTFDYSHIPSDTRFKPCNKNSKRLHIWTKRTHLEGDLIIENGCLTDGVHVAGVIS